LVTRRCWAWAGCTPRARPPWPRGPGPTRTQVSQSTQSRPLQPHLSSTLRAAVRAARPRAPRHRQGGAVQGARYARRPPAPHWEGTPSNHTTPSSLNNSSSSVYYLANYQGARMCESKAEDWLDLSGFVEIYHSCRPADATNTSNLSLTSWISYSLPVDSSHSRFVLLFLWISFILAIDFFCSCTCLFLLPYLIPP